MLKVEKKIQSEINRLEQMLYRHRTPVKGWQSKVITAIPKNMK